MAEWVDFQELKDRVPMAQVVEHYQLANTLRSRKGGDELAGLCPFHGSAKRRDDPFRISLSKNNFNCFQCKRGGNILDLVAEMEEVDVRQAALLIQQWFLGGSPSGPGGQPSSDSPSHRRFHA